MADRRAADPGARPLTVVLSSDQQGCLSLGAALFACDQSSVDQEMIDDTLRELVNMIGGQVRSAVAKEHSLGLARIDTSFNFADNHCPDSLPHECVVLRAGSVELAVQVSGSGFRLQISGQISLRIWTPKSEARRPSSQANLSGSCSPKPEA